MKKSLLSLDCSLCLFKAVYSEYAILEIVNSILISL